MCSFCLSDPLLSMLNKLVTQNKCSNNQAKSVVKMVAWGVTKTKVETNIYFINLQHQNPTWRNNNNLAISPVKKINMFSFSWTNIILGLFFAYLANSVYVFYVLFNPNECNVKKEGTKKCLEPSYKLEDLPSLKVMNFICFF